VDAREEDEKTPDANGEQERLAAPQGHVGLGAHLGAEALTAAPPPPARAQRLWLGFGRCGAADDREIGLLQAAGRLEVREWSVALGEPRCEGGGQLGRARIVEAVTARRLLGHGHPDGGREGANIETGC